MLLSVPTLGPCSSAGEPRGPRVANWGWALKCVGGDWPSNFLELRRLCFSRALASQFKDRNHAIVDGGDLRGHCGGEPRGPRVANRGWALKCVGGDWPSNFLELRRLCFSRALASQFEDRNHAIVDGGDLRGHCGRAGLLVKLKYVCERSCLRECRCVPFKLNLQRIPTLLTGISRVSVV
jgi:hypothetical protein